VRKLRVSYFIDACSSGAGTENQLLGMLRHLDPALAEAKLFTLRGEFPPSDAASIPWPIECLHVPRLISWNGARKFGKLVRQLRKERFDIAMIYFIDTNLFVTPACYLAGVPCRVVNRRDMGYWYKPGILSLLRLVNKLTNYFLVNSHAVKLQVHEKEKFPAERIKVIYNGMWNRNADDEASPELREPPRLLKKQDLGLAPDVPVVGIVANLRRVKRIDRFLEMARLVLQQQPEAQFLVLGQGELLKELQQTADRLGIADHVHFLGQVRDVPQHLALFDVGVLTSESEGLSNCLMEYAQAAVPAVAFDTGGNREIIRDGKTGYLVPNADVRQMAERVLAILADHHLQDSLGSANRQLSRRLFDPATIMAQTMEFFQAIITAGKNGWRCSSP
jgi:glycosyltransferase involved in cell wall biosynthesis